MSVKGRHAQKNHKGLTIFIVILLIVAILAVGAFVFREQITDVYNDVVKGTTTTTTTAPTTTTVMEATTAPADPTTIQATQLLENMDLNAKICQLFVVTPEELTGVDVATVAGQTTKKQLAKYPVGGIVYFEQNKEDDKAFAQMVGKTKSYAQTPLFVMLNGDKEVFTYSDSLTTSDKLCEQKTSTGAEAVKAFNDGAQVNNAFVMAFAPLIVPCFDVIRVYIHRIRTGKSPFLPDKNHIHHKLMRCGLTPRLAMISIISLSVAVTAANLVASFVISLNALIVADLVLYFAGHGVLNKIIARRNHKSALAK